MQNYWKNMRENHKYFEMSLEKKIWNFFVFYLILYNSILLLNWARPKHVQPDTIRLGRQMGQHTLFLMFFFFCMLE
jgi:hypothetical protein